MLISGLQELGTRFTEFGWLLEEVNDQITRIAETQAEIAAGTRAMLEAQQRTLMQLTILRQQTRPVHADGGGPAGLPGIAGRPADRNAPPRWTPPGCRSAWNALTRGLRRSGRRMPAGSSAASSSTAALLTRLAEQLTRPGLLMVLGPSGSGKSSLLRAGLLPAIAAGGLPARGSQAWPLDLHDPGAASAAGTGHPDRGHGRHSRRGTGRRPAHRPGQDHRRDPPGSARPRPAPGTVLWARPRGRCHRPGRSRPPG